MSLFCTKRILHSVQENRLRLETPLGSMEFKVKINGLLTEFNFLSNIKSIESDSFLSSWESSGCEIDCLQANFIPVLPSNMKVENCFAFIWRIKALDTLNISLSCLLDTFILGSPETGEYLIAQTFEDNSINLSIGTEDEEKLELRAKHNDWVPHRFQSTINSDNICYLDQGIEVNFALLKEEKIQIQFIVAWGSKKNNKLSTWYAVEQSAIEILQRVGFD